MKIVTESPKIVDEVASALKKGEVVICPTDTVYGFLADASHKKAVAKMYKIKQRPRSKPFSLFVKDIKMAKVLAEVDSRQLKMLKKLWPGKYTLILKRKTQFRGSNHGTEFSALYGIKKDTIAVRIPKYKFLNDLLKKINRPLVQTSVNISTKEPLNTIDNILATFGKNKFLGLIINGGSLKDRKPSKIINLINKNLTIVR